MVKIMARTSDDYGGDDYGDGSDSDAENGDRASDSDESSLS